MRMEIVVPQTAVSVSPGGETRLRIHVSNTGDAAVPVRIGLARGRLSAWARAEPSVVSAGPGEQTAVDLVFRPPASAVPVSTLQPFTVQAEDMRDGSVAARATGLLAVASPPRVTADLTVVRTRRRTVDLRLALTNTAQTPTTVTVRPTVESVFDGARRPGAPQDRAQRKAARKAERRVKAKPTVLDLPAGAGAETRIVARPRRALIGTRTPYVIRVSCVDAADDIAAALKASELSTAGLSGLGQSGLGQGPTAPATPSPSIPPGGSGAGGVATGFSALADDEPAPPLATVTHAGIAKPRLARTTATVLGLLLVAGLSGGAVWYGRDGGLYDQINKLRPGAAQRVEDPVKRPFALVEVYQKTGEPTAGREPADATRERLNSAGMQVRVVDSTTSAELADGSTGFWAVMRDGFASVEAVAAYCQQYRVIAPNCQVVP